MLKDFDLTGLRDRIKTLDGAMVKTGIQEGSPHIDKAIWNDGGTENIPERPFVSEFADRHEGDIDDASADAVRAIVLRKRAPGAALKSMGDDLAKQMQQDAQDWTTPPNAPSTVAKKGFDDPLFETGEMIADIKSKVEGA